MKLPEALADSLRDIVSAAVANHSDTDPAIEEAYSAFRPAVTDEDIDHLIHAVVQEAVYDRRHVVNCQAKRSTGKYGGRSRLKVASSAAVAAVSRSILDDFSIAGRCVGDLNREDLLSLAEQEDAVAGGHLRNRDLLLWLADRVKGKSRVRDCVKPAQIEGFLKDWERRHEAA